MTLLTIVQSACNRVGLPAPTSVINNEDQTAKQMLAFANEAGEELKNVFDWQALRREATFTTVAAETQTTLSSIASDLDRIVPETVFDRTARLPLFGPYPPAQWQKLKSTLVAAVRSVWTLRNNTILMHPTPAAGSTIALEYITTKWALAVDGTTGKTAFTVDTDTSIVGEELTILSVIWRFKKAKGLDYDEDFRSYQYALARKQAQETPAQDLRLGSKRLTGIDPFIPDGNWGV